MRIHLPHAWLAAAMIVVAVLAVPSQAQAHAGPHGLEAAAATAAALDLPDRSEAAGEEGAAFERNEVASTAQLVQTSGCGGVLCCVSACAACGTVLSSFVPYMAPDFAAALLARGDSRVSSGLGPQDLSRPPRLSA